MIAMNTNINPQPKKQKKLKQPRLLTLPKDMNCIKAIKTAMMTFSDEYSVTSSKYLSDKINQSSISYLNSCLNQFESKFLKVDELIIIIQTLQSHSKPILDYLANLADYTVSKKADPNNISIENLKDNLISLSADNGLLLSTFQSASSDNLIDEDERQSIIRISNQLRSQLVAIENHLEDMDIKE